MQTSATHPPTTTSVSESNTQRLEALQVANEIRSMRASVKRHWKSLTEKEVSEYVAILVASPPDWALTWRIQNLLRQIPQWGEVAVQKRLRQLNVLPETPLQSLTPGQRLGLVELLAPSLLTNADALADV